MKNQIEDVTKLPKWAQAKISQLEGSLEYWRGNAMVISGESESNITVDLGGLRDKLNIPNGTVQFNVGNGQIYVLLDSEKSGKSFIKIHGSGTMSNTIHITPWAANCCRIEIA